MKLRSATAFESVIIDVYRVGLDSSSLAFQMTIISAADWLSRPVSVRQIVRLSDCVRFRYLLNTRAIASYTSERCLLLAPSETNARPSVRLSGHTDRRGTSAPLVRRHNRRQSGQPPLSSRTPTVSALLAMFDKQRPMEDLYTAPLISRLHIPYCLSNFTYFFTIRYGRFTCAQKLTRWPA